MKSNNNEFINLHCIIDTNTLWNQIPIKLNYASYLFEFPLIVVKSKCGKVEVSFEFLSQFARLPTRD